MHTLQQKPNNAMGLKKICLANIFRDEVTFMETVEIILITNNYCYSDRFKLLQIKCICL